MGVHKRVRFRSAQGTELTSVLAVEMAIMRQRVNRKPLLCYIDAAGLWAAPCGRR